MGKMKRLTHIDSDGRAQMVDVSAKPLSKRRAVARGKIRLQRETLDLIARDQIAKGNVFATARIAGIQAAKQTAQLIPLCHTLPLGQVNIDIVASKDGAGREMHCADNCANGSGDGSPGRRHRRVADDLRHVQGSRQTHDHFRRAIA